MTTPKAARKRATKAAKAAAAAKKPTGPAVKAGDDTVTAQLSGGAGVPTRPRVPTRV